MSMTPDERAHTFYDDLNTDPAPLGDDELDALKGNTEGGIDPVRNQVLRLIATVEQARRERDAAVRQLEDALLIVWSELPAEQTLLLRDEVPRLMDFIAHLHHSIEHEQAMVRRNVWAEPS